MERALSLHSADVVRALIARAQLVDSPSLLGTLRLRPHQRDAITRIRGMLQHLGGALLADEAGLGKTYVALALAKEARSPLIVAPAALSSMWQRACATADVVAADVTYEALSRGRAMATAHDLIILDEAHHARTPGTRRYAQLASLASRARVLLLSATPIHNRRGDLAALLALFLGARAWTLDDEEMSHFVVRREHAHVRDTPLPALGDTELLLVGDDEATLHAILELPAPLPPRDGGDGGALLAMSLVRQWSSSDAALLAALRRRLARATSLLQALECGRYPTRSELAAWAFAEDSVQLAFPELIASALGEPSRSIVKLITTVSAHADAVRALLSQAAARSFDDRRANLLRQIRRRHEGEKIIAFAQFMETVSVLFTSLQADGTVAALTSRGGMVSGGKLSRRELLSRFAPRAMGARTPSTAERIDLLITTDLLSEGVNVQDASVVVHLDLPWTAARLEQRIGRSRRIGAVHKRTAVYALAPPASAAEMSRIEKRLHDKLRDAARAIGVVSSVLPGRVPLTEARRSAVSNREALYERLSRWQRDPLPDTRETIAYSGVATTRNGFVALVVDAGRVILLGGVDGEVVTDDPARLLDILELADGEETVVSPSLVVSAVERVDVWLTSRRAFDASGVTHSIAGAPRRSAIQRVARITAQLPLHRRAALLPLAARARQAITAQFGIGAERVLAELATASMPDDAWLRAVSAFGEARRRSQADANEGDSAVVAMLLLRAPSH
ncbi:MAG TPA: DEAD/DEAH box helicase [Gemmatimonadaceae bacterium]|nr:DEAD/DEAH box helicase [Gemmatimonadaceae bacterium]